MVERVTQHPASGPPGARPGPAGVIFTIGHSRHSWERFRQMLAEHGVQVLVDVRSRPVSRFAPWSHRSRLPVLLEAEGIGHRWMGEALGGKPADRAFYDARGRPDYGKIAATETFGLGVAELAALAQRRVVAIMCAEEDPSHCHRTLLVAPALEGLGFAVAHIRAGGEESGRSR